MIATVIGDVDQREFHVIHKSALILCRCTLLDVGSRLCSSLVRSDGRNIIVGALGCAIVPCAISIVRMRLHLSDKN